MPPPGTNVKYQCSPFAAPTIDTMVTTPPHCRLALKNDRDYPSIDPAWSLMKTTRSVGRVSGCMQRVGAFRCSEQRIYTEADSTQTGRPLRYIALPVAPIAATWAQSLRQGYSFFPSRDYTQYYHGRKG